MDLRLPKIFALRALAHAGPEPMAESTLLATVRLGIPMITDGEAREVIRALEIDGYVGGINDDLLGRLWSLTPRGRVRVQNIS